MLEGTSKIVDTYNMSENESIEVNNVIVNITSINDDNTSNISLKYDGEYTNYTASEGEEIVYSYNDDVLKITPLNVSYQDQLVRNLEVYEYVGAKGLLQFKTVFILFLILTVIAGILVFLMRVVM